MSTARRARLKIFFLQSSLVIFWCSWAEWPKVQPIRPHFYECLYKIHGQDIRNRDSLDLDIIERSHHAQCNSHLPGSHSATVKSLLYWNVIVTSPEKNRVFTIIERVPQASWALGTPARNEYTPFPQGEPSQTSHSYTCSPTTRTLTCHHPEAINEVCAGEVAGLYVFVLRPCDGERGRCGGGDDHDHHCAHQRPHDSPEPNIKQIVRSFLLDSSSSGEEAQVRVTTWQRPKVVQ